MSREQNIDDILKLLKDSVSAESQMPEGDRISAEHADISEDALKKQLKNRYFESDEVSEFVEETPREYILDNDFLDEVSQSEEDPGSENDKEIILVDETDGELSEDELIIMEEPADLSMPEIISDNVSDIEEDNTPTDDLTDEEGDMPPDNVDQLIAGLKPIDNTEQYTDDLPDIEDDAYPFEESKPQGVIDISTLLREETKEQTNRLIADDSAPEEQNEIVGTDEIVEMTEADEDAEWDEFVAEETLSEAEVSEEDVNAIEALENGVITSESETTEDSTHETFLASMRKIGMDFSDEDGDDDNADAEFNTVLQTDISVQAEEYEAAMSDEDISVMDDDEQIDLSTINLMMQFCEKDELKEKIGDHKVEEFLKHEQADVNEKISSHDFDGKEYVGLDQNDRISDAYKKSRKNALVSMYGCLILAVISMIFELLPMLNVKTSGLLDYTEYPAVYALVGLQLVAFSVAICYKQLWSGLKRAFSLTPNRHSLVAVVVGLTALYDLIIVMILAFSHDDIPNMFNAVASVTIAISAVADYADICCEMQMFSVYSSSAPKYALAREMAKGSVADKMYMGGLERDKNVYSVHPIDFPKGFFKCVSNKKSRSKLLTIAIVAVFLLGIIATVVSIIMGADAYASCAAFMVCLYAILPVSVIFADCIPFTVAAYKLAKRGSAIAGDGMIEKYNNCDVMVFGDLHMFKLCNTEEVGIALYDSSVGYLMLGCLDALYSRIGGPLSGMKMNLPDVFKFNDVNIRRITRTGVEAIIGKKHVLIVGERSFMQRYGLDFPDDEKKTDRSTLCVSLNGKVTAKLSVKYRPEPIFEMLVERLYSEGISCAIATYDPLINSAMIAAGRTIGESPVSVVHKNVEDFYVEKSKSESVDDSDGIIACSSRLKLAETEVWVKRLARIKKITNALVMTFSIVGAIILALLVALGVTGAVSQFYILGALLAEFAVISAVTYVKLPENDYFTIDALYAELEEQHNKDLRKHAARSKKKNVKIKERKTNE